jgi:isoquinoline 1-oxidoreductase subunit beta
MNDVVNLSRRRFLQRTTLTGGGLVLGVAIPHLVARTAGAAQETKEGSAFVPNAFVRIGADDRVTVLINHSEMGQGTFTSLSLLVAEELDADWSKVTAEHAPVATDYNHVAFAIQMVGGSTSTWTEWERLRKAGASARAMLVTAAANQWQVAPDTCHTDTGRVTHPPTGRELSYGKLVADASKLTPPKDVPLKDPKEFKLIGRATRRLDTPDKTNGKAMFGLDVAVPGMLVALVARPPVFGGKVRAFDDAAARAIPGVREVVEIDRGVAVVADGFWAAKLGREALQVEWDEGALTQLGSSAQRDEFATLAQKAGVMAAEKGDAKKALSGAAQRLEAVYEVPYLAHATMEPLNCVADVRADSCEVWTGTQFQTADRDNAARLAGVPPEKVTLHTMMLGGGFGRRAVHDSHFVAEAVQISKAIQRPVKVVWTREDDMRGGYYRPTALHAITAALDGEGKPLAWQHRVVCQSFIKGTPFESAVIHQGVDETAVEGTKDLPYEVPNLFVDWHDSQNGVPCVWWRSVGHSHSAFAVESFIDELARAASKDPFEFRRALLTNHPRHRRVLELVAEKAGWGRPLPPGVGRGIAVHESFGAFVAQVAEVSVDSSGQVRVQRVVCAIDCGPVVNPDGIRAQMESGIAFGLTAALYGEITFENGRVQQSNFHDYPLLRSTEMPVVETHIVDSTDKMGGVGETGVPPIAPAVANALFDLTGRRIRRLPISHENLSPA